MCVIAVQLSLGQTSKRSISLVAMPALIFLSILSISWGFFGCSLSLIHTPILRHQLIGFRDISFKNKNHRVGRPNTLQVKTKKLSQVEDDGYSLSQGRKPLWRKLFSKLLLLPQKPPGNLILIRHGESDLNYNKTFTGIVNCYSSTTMLLKSSCRFLIMPVIIYMFLVVPRLD